MCFKKKTPKKWEFGKKPVVNWNATNKAKYDMVTVCKIILTQILKIEDIELSVFTSDRQVSMFDTDDLEVRAILQKTTIKNHYVLTLRSDVKYYELLSVICHEMVHLKQYVQNKLDLKNHTFYWNGKEYPKSTSYWARPWEIEARREQTDIEKKVKDLYYE